MASSAFAVQQRQKVDSLLQALVTAVCHLPVRPQAADSWARVECARSLTLAASVHFTSTKPSDKNFQVALEFCTYHTRCHSQLDVDPWEVERAYAALEGT